MGLRMKNVILPGFTEIFDFFGGEGVKNQYIGVNQDFANSSKGWGVYPPT